MNELRWGILGTGTIANEMAGALAGKERRFAAVAGRNPERTAAFAEKYGISRAFTDCGNLLTDPEVDAVYIATPHNTHFPISARRWKTASMCLPRKPLP